MDKIWPKFGQDMAKYLESMAEILTQYDPRFDTDMVKIQPMYGQDVAKVELRYDQDKANDGQYILKRRQIYS